MLPNRAGFLQHIFRQHHPRDVTGDGGRRFPHQQWVRDYLDYRSPHRGLLLYHGLGVGKTCASIAAAEGFVARRRKVVVLLPASLEGNYRGEIEKCSRLGARAWYLVKVPSDADLDSKDLRKRFLEEFHLDKADGAQNAWIPYVPKFVPTAWVERARVPLKSMTDAERAEVANALSHMVKQRYAFLHYNGLTLKNLEKMGDHYFDNALIIIDEVHTFISRVIHGGKIARKIYNQMLTAKGARFVLLSGTPIINQPFELAYLLNLVRGPMVEHELTFLKQDTRAQVTDDAVNADIEACPVLAHIDDWRMVRSSGAAPSLRVVFLPYHFERGASIGTVQWSARAKSADACATELKAWLEKKGWRIGAAIKHHAALALPNDEATFNEWFLDQRDGEVPRMKNIDLFQRRILGTVSYFRTADDTLFPELLPMTVERVPLTNHQFRHYLDVRAEERRMEANTKMFKGRKGGDAGVTSVYRAFSRMACNFVFPEDVPRPFPKDISKALAKEIDVAEEDAAADADAEALADAETKKYADANAKETKAKDDRKQKQKLYQEALSQALQTMHARRADVFTTKALEDTYAPKMARLVKDLATAPGKSLIYSQFRTVEGLGLLQEAMQQAGWAEVKLVRKAGTKAGASEWSIADADKVLGDAYTRKRYIVFGEDGEKNAMLLKLFRENWKQVPEALHTSLTSHGITTNLRGESIAALLITQSGAEGISTTNVRNVYILEPFWNQVRIDQVIGRAVRTGSHLALPKEERNVRVLMYVASLTPKQLKDHFTLQAQDKSKTSDEHILDRATAKHKLVAEFLDAMKVAATDCLFNASANKPDRCYAFPVHTPPEELVSWPDMAMDARPQGHELQTRQMKGRVVEKKGVKYVKVEGDATLYDYHAWKFGRGVVV